MTRMRIVCTRVSSASVTVDDATIAELPRPGLLVLAGVGHADTVEQAAALARKIWGLRILDDELSASDVDAPILVVSQFTLAAETAKGLRPGFSNGAAPELAERLYEYFVARCRDTGLVTATGRFAADMQVSLINDGPVTFWLEV